MNLIVYLIFFGCFLVGATSGIFFISLLKIGDKLQTSILIGILTIQLFVNIFVAYFTNIPFQEVKFYIIALFDGLVFGWGLDILILPKIQKYIESRRR